ncbi:glycosyltransferase [Pseudobutyrivibrio sp.]|uniref:glycosyltransferase n=1 Tax=Pseudobutyrivibrio sp. TaxID=2014367 RepID=UPI00386DF3A3
MILHVIKSNIYSGAENVVCQIIKGLSGREEFVYMAPHGPIEDKLRSIGLINCYRGIDKLSVYEIKKAVEELHPDVVHAHDFTASVLCGIALKGKVPVISHLHCNPLWLKNPLHPKSFSYYFANKWYAHIITVSDSIAEEYCYASKLKCPITTMGNPFSTEAVLKAASEEPDSDINSDLLYVGRFNQAKNPLGAIKIFESLPDKDSLIFMMVGNGELLDECKEYVSSHDLSDRIIFEGYQENVYKYMNKTKVLLMPSIFEGFGLVALEAMTLGKPVVCSGVGGLTDIVNDSCGYICNDINSYGDSISELLRNASIYSSKSEGAIRQAQVFDNSNAYCDQLYGIYQNLK